MEYVIPLMVQGELKEGADITLTQPTDSGDVEVLIPEINESDLERVKSTARDIHELSLDEIIDFYCTVGAIWGDRNNRLRKEATEIASKVTGYHRDMISHSYDMIAEMFSRDYLEKTVEGQFRNRSVLDEWVGLQDYFIHAQPRGRVLHILSGNAPPIAGMSFLRGSLTKNSNIIKIPSGDPVTAAYLALSFREVDASHPVTKTTSVVYWQHDSPVESQFIRSSDAVCVWGGKDAVESVRRKSGYGTQLLDFGPRKSFQFIELNGRDKLKEITEKTAHDLILYDQEACHSPQIVFLKGDSEKFCDQLTKSVIKESRKLPKGFVPIEKHGHVSNERAMAKFYGEKVYTPGNTEWTLIVSNKMRRISSQHPLSRTLYIFEVDDLKDAVKYVDKTVQTVAVHPPEKIRELRDELTLNGVERVTHLGKMGYFATGSPHDGIYPLAHLVRFVKSR